jgi:methylenetetrahydrofolate dehydrogenase (NADP+)/methenyltetrahydrofolate cyclohydrolase
MMIDGKKIAKALEIEMEQAVRSIQGRKPSLAFILVGENPASLSYVRAKRKACLATGISSTLIELASTVSQEKLIEAIQKLNRDPGIDGILVQLPLPRHIDARAIMLAIDPLKDVDAFHPMNVGKLLLGEEGGFLPCTPNGIKVLLEKSNISVSGKHVVILGRSNIVGKPLAALLVQKKEGCNATVTIAHSGSERLKEICKSADILVAAVGQARFVTKEMVRPHSVVIDVGINRLPDGSLAGDVDFANVSPIVSHITPVPGGVGPMTIAMLLQNTLLSFRRRHA